MLRSPRPTMSRHARTIFGSVFAGVATGLAVFAGCQAFGGRPAGDGSASIVDAGNALCLGTCQPDPGWRPVDCTPANGIDTLSVVSFDDPGSTDSSAANMYSYTDGTAGRLLFAYVNSNPSGIAYSDAGWQPPTYLLPPETVVTSGDAGLCSPKNAVLHVLGGPFRGWGGGLGVSMEKLNGRSLYRSPTTGDSRRNLCAVTNPPDICPPESAEYAVQVAALDVSKYDGVSFWARRGPDSQVGLRVNVGDKYTDDDLSYLAYHRAVGTHRPICDDAHSSADCEPIHCQRVRECACRNHKACTYYETAPTGPMASTDRSPGWYCGATAAEVNASLTSSAGSGEGTGGSVDDRFCDTTACDRPYAAFATDDMLPDGGTFTVPDGGPSGIDVQFYGRACTPYAFANGIGSRYCFDPGSDPPPSPDTGICGDHWMTTVDLSTEWQFFKVPFTDLHQQGYGRRSQRLDLTSVSVIRFTWDVGFIDYWIDDVSFYRIPR